MAVLDRFSLFMGQQKLSPVALDSCSSYKVTIVWELGRAESPLLILDEWSPYRGGWISRFDCVLIFEKNRKNS